MKYIDLNVAPSSETVLSQHIEMALKLGYSGLGIGGNAIKDSMTESNLSLHPRTDLKAHRLPSLKKEARKARNHFVISAVSLGSIDTANWAAEDSLIDILTLNPTSNEKLRKTTAKLAALNGTALEIIVNPLLTTKGLDRSRIIKIMRDTIHTAIHTGMDVILTSGGKKPIQLRSPRAMYHIGIVLGLDASAASAAICDNPYGIVAKNIKRLDESYILSGLEIVGEDS